MFEDDTSASNDINDLFADEPIETEPEAEAEEVAEEQPEESEAEEEKAPQDEPEEQSSTESEEEDSEKPQQDNTIAVIEVNGKEFKLDAPQVQTLAEKYIDLVQKNKQFEKSKESVDYAMKFIENVRNGVDIDESMKALGVNFDALIRDKVKDFIRRSTMSEKERELEDANKEREKLRKQIHEREERERLERETAEGQKEAETIIAGVNQAISKVPQRYQQEIQIEVFGAIERRLRNGQGRPSQKAIDNAVQTIYNRKYKAIEETKKKVTPQTKAPKPVKNSPTPSTQTKSSGYNATDYSHLFK